MPDTAITFMNARHTRCPQSIRRGIRVQIHLHRLGCHQDYATLTRGSAPEAIFPPDSGPTLGPCRSRSREPLPNLHLYPRGGIRPQVLPVRLIPNRCVAGPPVDTVHPRLAGSLPSESLHARTARAARPIARQTACVQPRYLQRYLEVARSHVARNHDRTTSSAVPQPMGKRFRSGVGNLSRRGCSTYQLDQSPENCTRPEVRAGHLVPRRSVRRR